MSHSQQVILLETMVPHEGRIGFVPTLASFPAAAWSRGLLYALLPLGNLQYRASVGLEGSIQTPDALLQAFFNPQVDGHKESFARSSSVPALLSGTFQRIKFVCCASFL